MSDLPRSYTESIATPESLILEPIGVVRSEHKERHGTPRQASVANEAFQRKANARIELFSNAVDPESLQDLDGFDRIWIIGNFHLNQGYRSLVVPPRGPRIKRGLYSTRSPHRKNGLSLSCAKLLGIDGLTLRLESLDLLDGTPVFDLKPYIPFADAFPDSRAGWVDELE